MAILFGRVSNVSRGSGNSAIKAAAYRSCSELTLNATDADTNITVGLIWDYSKKGGLAYSQIHAPEDAPEWVYDRQSLWQRVEDVETKSNARLAGEYTIALPKEFTTEQNIEFLKEFADNVFVSRGIVVDVNFHNDNSKNPHAHLMYALRQLEKFAEGVVDFATHRCRELQTRAFLEGIIKEEHKQLLNKHLIKNGFEERLEWGVVRGQEATIHHGGVREAYARNEQIIRSNADKIIADPTIVIDKLDFNKAVFTKENIASELEKALYITLKNAAITDKSALDVFVKTELVGLLDTVLLSPKLTLVNSCDLKGRMLFAKTEQVELEQRLVGNIGDLAKNNDHALRVGEQDIAEYKKGDSFSRQQKEAIIGICNGHDLAVLEGWPGSGKSTVTKEIVRLYQKEGYNIVAAAPTNKAAQELEAKLGIKVHTTASLRMQWQYDRGMEKVSVGLDSQYYKDTFYSMKEGALPANTLLVLDEASMLDVATSDYFVSEVSKSGAKLLLLGDNNQNQAIGSKGAFARMGEMAGRNILSEVNRHKNKDEEIRQLHIEATSALCNYQVSKAISIYEQLSKINILDNEADKEQAIATEYVKQSMFIAKEEGISLHSAAKKIVISAYTNEEIGNLNGLIRDSFKRAGVLGQGNKFISGGVHGNSSMVELTEGDRIIFTSNLKEKEGIGGVLNNELATVRKIIKVDEMGVGEFLVDVEGATGVRSAVIRTGEQGRIVTFRHGYAVTNHAVQGATVPYKIFSMDRYSGYEATLVGLTRHQIDCQIFAAKDTLESEVYKTKDLDVEAARQEFAAMGYEYVQKFNDEGREYWKKEDVPLWKLGLGILTSKRSDLSFAIDASYGHESIGLQKQLSGHQAQLEVLRVDLGGHEQELTKFEAFAKEHFKVTEDIVFDITEVMAAPERFSVSGESGNIHDLENHLTALKGGIHFEGKTSALDWSDLSKQDQDLLLWSYIDKEERAGLEQHFVKSQSLKEEILDKAQDASGIWDKLKESGLKGHESLTGNYADIKDYLAARQRVAESWTQQEAFNKQLSGVKIQRLLVAGIDEKYSLKLQFITIDASGIDKALKNFERQKEKSDLDQLRKDPKYQAKSIVADRQIYLQNLTKNGSTNANFKEIISNAHLFVADIMHSAAEGTPLHELANALETHNRQTALAKSQRLEAAKKILANWHKTVDVDNAEKDNTQSQFSKITAQLNINHNTLQKHAGHTTAKHYFNKLATHRVENNSLGNNRDHLNGDYQEIMHAIYKAGSQGLEASDIASLIKAHDGLCEHIELTNTHIEELKQDRLLAQNNLNSSRFKLKEIKTYQETEFPHFISTLYKDDSEVVIAKFDESLKVSSDPTQLASVISNNPEMLGRLKARNLIAKIFGSDERKAVDINLTKLGNRLSQYIKGKNEMQQLHQNEHSGKYVGRLAEIDRELGALRASLPSHQEIDIIEDIGKMQSRILKDSESTISIDRFSKELNKLLLEDKAQDALFSYQTKHNVFFTNNKAKQSKEQGANAEVNELKQELQQKARYIKNDQNSKQSSKPSLTFEEVRNGLNQTIVAEIFSQYAQIHNPDGKIQKRGSHVSCGSLSMDLGNKLGLWKRFSDGTKGDIFSFVEKATGCSKFESLEIVANHAGIVATNRGELKNQITNNVQTKAISNIASQPRDEWVARGVIPESIAEAFNKEKDLAFLVKKDNLATNNTIANNKITNTYKYRNIDNELLGFAVRIEEGATGNKKVLPVAYCHNEASGKSRWMSKGFSDNGTKPIYGLEKLAKAPSQPILIVEGEKTADAASKLFQDHTVISWMGGAQSVDRVDWSKLSNKIITIWPDNDAPGISAAKNIEQHLNNHNGFTGLVSVVDTKQLGLPHGLPEKWDLADELPDHLAREQLDQIVEKANIPYSQGLGVFSHEVSAQEQRSNRVALSSIDMLVETGRIDKDEYISKEIYHDTMAAIASKLKLNLSDSEGFGSNIRSVQEEYQKLHREYALGNQTQDDKGVGVGEKTINDLLRDTCVLHQVQLGVNKLTRTHREHIENTAKEEVAKMKQFGVSDREHAGSNMYKAITSNNWLETLVGKNEQQANAIKLKFTAKTIDEFLVDKASSSKELHEHLANIRKYGIEEHAILKSFKTDPALGAEHLASIDGQLSKAETFATKHKAIIDEARQWGYNHNDIASTRSIIGMDESTTKEYFKEIRNAQLFKYIEDKFNSPEYAKPISKLDQMKGRLLEQQSFLKDTYESLKSPENLWGYGKGANTLISGQHLCKNPNELNHLFKLADEIVERNIMPEYVLCRDLGTTNQLSVLVGKTERTIDYYNFRTIPERLSQLRQDAKCVDSVFVAIEKEQDTLAGMHGNIKKLDIYNELLLKCELAHEQREHGDLAKLKLLAENTLSTGTKTTESLVKELQQTTDLKETHKKLDQDIEAHHINSSLSTIEIEKQEAKTPDQVIDVIKKEQRFLAQLHGNLKYPERDLNITARAKLAKELKQDGLHKGLESLAKTALTTGAKTAKSLIKELQQTTDLKETHKKLDQDIEAHHINSNLAVITKEKQEAKTPDHVIYVIKKEQKFLAQLHSNLKHPEHHGKDLAQSIQNAMKNEHDNVIGQLHKLSSYVQSANFKTHEQMTKILKDTDDPMATHKSLLKDYHDNFIKNVHKGLNRLDDGHTVKIDNHTISCPLKFMEHLVKTRTSEFMPHHEIQQIHNQVIQQQRHLEMEKDMGGYSM